MVSLNMIHQLGTELCQQGYNSHASLRTLDNTIIDKLFEEKNITDMLKHEISQYLDWLFINHPYHYYKKIIAEKQTQNQLNWCDQFLLTRFIGDERAYRNLPLLLYLLIQKLDIKKYKYVSIEDITSVVYRTFDISTENHIDWGIVSEIKHKCHLNDYSKFDSTYDPKSVNVNNIEEFAVWAEHKVYDNEFSLLKKYNYEEYAKWVSREYGDGYGFDILSIDLDKNKECLIEVKSGKNEKFSLTQNEVNVMRNCQFKNADYYVYKWTYNYLNNYITPSIYKYDPEIDLLVDPNNNYYSLLEYHDNQNNKNRFVINKLDVKTKTLV